MIEATKPENEAQRLQALLAYGILDTDPESAFDDLARLASQLCGTPIALVSLVDAERQWFKARVGLDATETPRSVAFCSHAILDPNELFVVENAHEDHRFADNPLVTGDPKVCFYAGAPLVEASGLPMGTLCVIDHSPRQMPPDRMEALRTLAQQVVTQLELRKKCFELRDLAQALQRSNRELEDFTHVAAHDLQEPLRKIVSFGELLRQDIGSNLPARAEEDLQFMTDASLRMRDLIQDLLQLSRVTSSKLTKNSLDLRECVGTALEALSLKIEECGAEIVVEDLPTVDGDHTLLTQLFQNLISNAIKFVADVQPRIHVTCAERDGEIVIGVRDNGIGIDPEMADQVFKSFKRLHSRRDFEGTGIGLSIARKAVERHGGRIWVDSVPGQGSHFQFVLTAAKMPSTAPCSPA